MRRGFEEKLRPASVIDPIVKVAASRRLRLLDARFPATIVGDSGGPHFLIADGSLQVLECGTRCFTTISSLDLAQQVPMQIVSRSQ